MADNVIFKTGNIEEKAPSITPGQILFSVDNNNKGEIYFDKDSNTRIQMSKVDLDNVINSVSVNPVQNKVINEALNNKLSLTGGTLTGDLSLSNGTTQTKVSIGRTVNNTGYEMQEYINYQGNAYINLYKDGSQINGIVMSESDIKLLKPIVLEGGSSGNIAAQTRSNLGLSIDNTVTASGTNPVSGAAVATYVDENTTKIVYSVTEPASPVEGMIWLCPIS